MLAKNKGILKMMLSELCATLDDYFRIDNYPEQDYWVGLISEAERGAIQRFLRPAFADVWNGLMLENLPESGEVNCVYLAVSPSQDVLDTVIAREVERGAPGALVFTHHPLAYSERDAAFSPVSTAQLEEFGEHNISLYVCHDPLDCHPETSTAVALADALYLEEQERVEECHEKHAIIHGKVMPTTFQQFAERLAEVCELDQLRYDQCRHNGQFVHHVAVMPGGGGDLKLLNDIAALGVDTYVTGQWWLFGANAADERERMRLHMPHLRYNMLATSRYSSELIVMRDEMVEWFKQHNLDVQLIRQEDPWQ